MNIRVVSHLISFLLMMLALAMGISIEVSYLFDDPVGIQIGLAVASGLTLVAGLLLWVFTRGPVDLSRRDGYGIVSFGWIAAALFGALPYLLTGVIADPVTAVFETMSGFTTTGATVLENIDDLPRGILFWRAMTQWFGGMGVLVLCVAILPFLGVGGMQIYRAEIPGPSKDRLTPRIASTAKMLWGIYLGLTAAQTGLLMLGGLSWFDAVCHTFTTLSTGGFGNYADSIAAFDSLYVECVVLVFMFLAGINFALHFRVLTGKPLAYFRDAEFRFFAIAILIAIGFVTLNVYGEVYTSVGESLRAAAFQVVSIITTTGFCTEDFDLWPESSRILLVLLMFLGGCAGSTAGGMKVVRVFVVLKKTLREIRLFMQPHAVVQIKLGRKPVLGAIESNILSFFIIFSLLFGLMTFCMAFFTPNLETAATSVIATLGNIGPGLNAVGATQNYAFLPAPGKALLTVCMLLGRLELYTVLVLLLPEFWKK